MKTFKVILLLCFVQISIFIRSTTSQYIGFGNFGYGFGPSLPIPIPMIPNGSGRSFGGFPGVSQDLVMGQNCQIGSYCQIASGCSMGDNVFLGNYVQMDVGASIGSNSQVMDYASLGSYATMGPNNLMNPYAKIQENANIGSGCIMGMHANIGPNAKLERNVYAGDHCQVGVNAAIGDNSIIQPYAMVPDNGYVGPNEMVIRTPTTSQLYQNCLPVNEIPQSDINLADQGQPEHLNERVRQLMSTQKQSMESNCQRNAQAVDFKPLGLAVSLYMIRCDGLNQFMQNMGQGNGGGGVFSLGNFGIDLGEVYVNGVRVFGAGQTGGDDKHFVEGSKKVLHPELENDMVELLALKEDSQRSNRVPGDTFCKTVSEVQNKQKKVKCDQAVDVSSPIQNSRPQTPNQGGGNGHPSNNSPRYNRGNQQPQQPNRGPSNNPNGYESPNCHPCEGGGNGSPNQGYPDAPQNPNILNNPNQQFPNQQFPNQPNNEQKGQNPRPSYSNHNNVPKNPNRIPPTPSVTDDNDHQMSNPVPNNQRPTQGTNQPTLGYPSNSYAPNNPIPNNREPGRRPNPNPPNMSRDPFSPPSTSHDNQPNHPPNNQGDHQNRPPTKPNSRNPPNCNQCNIQPDTSIGDNVDLGNNLNIGKGTTIGNNCKIGDSATVGDGVTMGDDSVVSENANVGNNCILDDNSKVGPNANVQPGSYVGKNCDVGANAFVGENSIVLDNAKVPDGGHIGSNDVVIPTPTSADLYSNCAPIESVPQNLISQPDPNNNLRQMMRGQIEKVRSHCQQPSQQLLDFASLASAKTIYLISLHGVPGFTENLQNVLSKANGNGNYDKKAYEKLMNEDHFVDNGQPSRIEPDVKGEMIVMMAIEQDFGRGNRSPGNTFCQTFMDIASKQRQVKCDK